MLVDHRIVNNLNLPSYSLYLSFLFHTLQDLTPIKDLSKGFAGVESATKELIFELFIFSVSDLFKGKKKKVKSSKFNQTSEISFNKNINEKLV